MTPTQSKSPHAPPLRGSLPPEGALRLQFGKAGPAAPAGEEVVPQPSSMRLVAW